MLNRLKSLFSATDKPADARAHDHDELTLTMAVLLVEAALMDGEFDEAERAVIHRHVVARLGGEGAEDQATALVAVAEEMAHATAEYATLARRVKDGFEYEERVAMVEMLWEVAYADGELHDYEASLLRRIAGLLYVADRDSGRARKSVLARLGVTGD